MQRFLSLCRLGVAFTIVMGSCVGSRGIYLAEAVSVGPQERWVFTTKGHFWWYGLLTGAPIAREEIRGVLLDSERIYLAVSLGEGGAQFLALDRRHGRLIWEQRLVSEGYPTGKRFARVGKRLVATLLNEKMKGLVILGIDSVDGRVAWRTTLPINKEELRGGVILEANPKADTVSVYLTKAQRLNRVVLHSIDGQQISANSYNGYLWSSGSHQAANLIFGYHGRMPGEYDRLLAFQKSNGQLAWTLPLSRHWVSPPTVIDDSLLITDKNRLLKIDLLSGKFRWTAPLPGRAPGEPEPPVVIGQGIAVIHTTTPHPDDKQWKLGVYRLADGTREKEVKLGFGESIPWVLRRIGNLVIVGSGLMLQLVDPQSARVLATLDFEKMFSFFVYADPPSMRVADSDPHGFVVTTTDGKLRYFAAEDFRTAQSSSALPTDTKTSQFSVGMIFYYLVVNPLWDILQANRTVFWAMFYGFPFLLLALVWVWKPLWAWLRRLGASRGAKWGGWIGVVLALPAAIYRGLLGGMAAGFGTYGAFGPIWGGVVGFGTFAGMGLLLGIIVGSLISMLWRARKQAGRKSSV